MNPSSSFWSNEDLKALARLMGHTPPPPPDPKAQLDHNADLETHRYNDEWSTE